MKKCSSSSSGMMLLYFAIFSFILLTLTGGPWVDLDGHYYQHMAEKIGGHLFMSNWYPVGMAMLIRALWTLGFSVFWVAVIGNSLRLWLQYLIFRRVTSLRCALVLTFLCQGFSWLVLGIMLKAETLFMTGILGMVYCLMSERPRVRHFGSLAFFLLALLFRHAGLFLAPAYFLALWQTENFRLKGAVWSVALVAGGMFIGNAINSGSPLRPSRESFACMHFIAGANTFDYCARGLAPELCALDPNGTHLNKNDLSMAHLNHLQFNPDWAPQKLLKSKGQPAVCAAVNEIYGFYISREPFHFARQILGRVWTHLGGWESAEFGQYSPRKDNPVTLEIKDNIKTAVAWLSQTRILWRLLIVLSLPCMFYFFVRRRLSPACTFLMIAGLAHCGGIVLNNPFLVMRYQEVTHLLLLSGIFLCALDLIRENEKRSQHDPV